MTASFLKGFKISDIDQIILTLIFHWDYFDLTKQTLSLAVSLSDIKTIDTHYTLISFVFLL